MRRHGAALWWYRAVSWVGDRSMPRWYFAERRWDEFRRKLRWYWLASRVQLAQVERKDKLLTSQATVGVAIRHRPNLSEHLLRDLRLQQNAAGLGACEEATASLIGRVEQLGEFQLRWLWNGPIGSTKRGEKVFAVVNQWSRAREMAESEEELTSEILEPMEPFLRMTLND